MRIFCFAEGNYEKKLCGGGKGVAYRLLLANKKYCRIDNMYFVFGDAMITPEEEIVSRPKDGNSSDGIKGLMLFYDFLDDRVAFSSEDVYIFHDLPCFYAMKKTVAYIDHTAVVYHGQGSLFHEAEAYKLNPDEDYRNRCNLLTEYVLSNAQLICFPSQGAKEAFIATSDDSVNKLLENCPGKILYNGCSPHVMHDDPLNSELLELIDRKKGAGKVFVTVATLNEAKGVERLPVFFEDYGKTHEYLWIVVGDGGKRTEFSEEIKAISENVIWVQKPLPNDVILRIYEKADYYILTHRISIFDYATIEAMHCGLVPVLTPVGGNIEMIRDDNGFFIDGDIGDSAKFAVWEEEQDLNILKKKNIEIAQRYFSEKSMLEEYKELAEELCPDKGRKDLLVIVPDLERNEAQLALHEFLKLEYFYGKKIDMISSSKGSYGKIYRDMGVNVQIRQYIAGDGDFRQHMLNDYERIFINTASCDQYLLYFINTKVPVYIWVHEISAQQDPGSFHIDPRMYSSNIHLLGATEIVRHGMSKKYGKIDIMRFPMIVPDQESLGEPDIGRIPEDLLGLIDGKVLFFIPAAYTVANGQNALLEAILKLPEGYRERAHFILCGDRTPGQDEYYGLLRNICDRIGEVTMLDGVTGEDKYLWYQVSDCILLPAGSDDVPVSIAEAMMFSKVVLIPDSIAISEYPEDGVNAFVFPAGNTEGLMRKIMHIISNYEELGPIGEKGRRVYEENFSPRCAEKQIEEIFSD